MSEDMSAIINKINSMLNSNDMPDNIKNIVNNLSSNNSDVSSTSNTNNSNCSEDVSTQNSDNSSFTDFDINTILKMKNVIDSINSNKDDPRANLLRSLKPYLKESRKNKVEQYIKMFSMGKVFEALNPLDGLGGDSKK